MASLAAGLRGPANLAGLPSGTSTGAAELSLALSEEQEQLVLSARERTNCGPMRLSYLTERQRSTIWKVLHRHGCSRRRRSAQRESSRRYEWSEAGALLHIDAFQVPKFEAPGHWATGRRKERSRRVGKTVVIGVIDDHTRLAYCELHSAENGLNVSATSPTLSSLV